MTLLHDPAVRSGLESRLDRLTPTNQAVWGRMNAAQMLWHCNQSMAAAMGQAELSPKKPPIPKAIIKFAVLNLPWTRNAPTNEALVARNDCDFNTELARCRKLMAEFVARPIDGPARDHPAFGVVTVTEQSRLQAKHLDHHLRQFGV